MASVGRTNPIKLLQNHVDRIIMLHIKDGAISPSNPNTAIGEGTMDYPTLFTAIPSNVEWLFVELENCATDIVEAVRKSVRYCNNL